MSRSPTAIRIVRWVDRESEIRAIRETVFMHEQGVPEELEWDGLDPVCEHVLAYDERGEAIGTGRLSEDGRIGRMAVLKPWRGRGLGRAILVALLERARKRSLARVSLAAQTYAIGFYEKYGFRATGDVFPDAGIPHQEMYLDL